MVLLLALGCSSDDPREELRVFAASSLTGPMQDLERSFEQARPDVDVHLTFAGSQVLRLQIEQGAQADVFASADARQLDPLVAAAELPLRLGLAHRHGVAHQALEALPYESPPQL